MKDTQKNPREIRKDRKKDRRKTPERPPEICLIFRERFGKTERKTMTDFRNIRERRALFCRKTEERLPKAPKTAQKPAFFKERPKERLLKAPERFRKN